MQGFPFTLEHRVIFRDCDMLGHVNNAVYSTYFETGRLEYFAAMGDATLHDLPLILAEITITFKSPAYLRETLQIGVRVAEIRNSSFMMESQIVEKESQRLVATSRAVLVHYDYGEQRPKAIPQEWRDRFAAFEGRAL